MQTLTFHIASLWDGADGRMNKELWFDNEQATDDWKKANTYDSAHKRVINVYHSVQDYIDNAPDKVKARALAKLTYEERKALGY